MAETEKYPHVTYFLDGGDEARHPGEDRITAPVMTQSSRASLGALGIKGDASGRDSRRCPNPIELRPIRDASRADAATIIATAGSLDLAGSALQP
jgi:hypothetical protein